MDNLHTEKPSRTVRWKRWHIYAVSSGVLVLALRWLGDKLILPGSTFEEEIARDRNAGVGFIEATLYVSGALAASYFLT